MAKRPDVFADWYDRLHKKTPASAGHCGRIIRAIYRREGKRDIHLPARLPTSAIEFEAYKPSQVALDFGDYPAWRAKWDKIESQIERGYHLFCLLAGARPGEASRMTVNDIDLKKKMFVIRNSKSDRDLHIPMSPEIEYAIKLATSTEAKPHHEVNDKSLLFPGCKQVSARADLPIRGQKLRHSWRAVCADLGVDDLISNFLLGHSPKGISQAYIPILILANGPGMKAAQAKISKRIFKLLGLTLGGHDDAPLVPRMPNRAASKARV